MEKCSKLRTDNWMECICGKKARYTKSLKLNNFKIDGWKCGSCGEEYYNPEKSEKIFILNKLNKKV